MGYAGGPGASAMFGVANANGAMSRPLISNDYAAGAAAERSGGRGFVDDNVRAPAPQLIGFPAFDPITLVRYA